MSAAFEQLGAIAKFINGAAFEPEDWGNSGARIIRIQNLTDPTKPFNRTTRSVPEQLHVHPGDLLVSWSATLGVFEWTGPDVAVLNQHIFRVVPDERKVHKHYLHHGLELALLDMQRHLHGATMQHVNRREFLSTRLYLPSLAEQQRIAKVLDRADELRAKRRAALAQLDTLTQAIFLDLFGDPATNPKGWPVHPVSDYVSEFQGGKSVEAESDENLVARNRVLKVSAVTGMRFLPEESKPVPERYEPPPEHFVRHGDLLFSRANTTELVGAIAYIWDTPHNLLLPDKLWRFVWRDASTTEPLFVWALFQTAPLRYEIGRRATGTSGSMKNISQKKVLGIRTIVPPPEAQHEFARRVVAVEKLKAAHRASLAELDALFASLQYRAFRGEL